MSWRSKTIVIPLLLMIIAGGAYLRLAHLNRQSLWVDEMNHVVAAQSLLRGEGAVFPSGLPYTRSLLFTKLVACSFAFFGVSEFSARLPGAIFGVLSIPLVYFVARRMFRHPGIGLIAAFLQAFAPFNIGWSRVCRMYAVFQFFFLLAVYAIYEGAEGSRLKPAANSRAGMLRRLVAKWNIDFFWMLIAAIALSVATYLQVLSGVLLPGLMLYFLLMLFGVALGKGAKSALTSKYLFYLVVALIGVAAIVSFAPEILAPAHEAMNFSPNWAQYDYVQNPFYYLWFLTSNFYFTIATFFAVGVVMAIAELRKPALYLLVLFLVPLALLSTLFVLKVERYIFHLFPLYLIVAAYGTVKLFKHAVAVGKDTQQQYFLPSFWSSPLLTKMVMGMIFLSILGSSDWLRFARRIPSLRAGTNGAVTHEEWREACAFVRNQRVEGQPVISTLPVAVYYYLGRIDYFLASMENHRNEEIVMKNGVPIDYYSNANVIDTVEDLQRLMQSQPRGWLIVDLYRLGETRYVRPAVQEFIQRELRCIYVTPEKTVAIYSWG